MDFQELVKSRLCLKCLSITHWWPVLVFLKISPLSIRPFLRRLVEEHDVWLQSVRDKKQRSRDSSYSLWHFVEPLSSGAALWSIMVPLKDIQKLTCPLCMQADCDTVGCYFQSSGLLFGNCCMTMCCLCHNPLKAFAHTPTHPFHPPPVYYNLCINCRPASTNVFHNWHFDVSLLKKSCRQWILLWPTGHGTVHSLLFKVI